MIVAIIVAVIVVLVLVLVLALRSRRSDPVASFQRHIDALGPEARRPTVDRVRRIDDDSGETGPDAR